MGVADGAVVDSYQKQEHMNHISVGRAQNALAPARCAGMVSFFSYLLHSLRSALNGRSASPRLAKRQWSLIENSPSERLATSSMP
jgi:hypothetical protein